MTKPITALIIMDGFGLRSESNGNAVLAAGIPHLYDYMKHYPYTSLGASGMSVGLPEGQMGNSEVGHLNLGAGRIVYQELTRISKSIADGDFFERPALLDACRKAKENGGKLHVMGLLSDGGVHSHIEHLFALVRLAKQQGLSNIYIHAFMDGRDVPPNSGKDYVMQLEDYLVEQNFGRIATISGRYYAMDRDNRWERVQRAYDAVVEGEGLHVDSAVAAMEQSYARNELDEFVQPTVVCDHGTPVAKVEAGDSVIFFNFRPDRTRELTRAMIYPDFDGFARKSGYKPVFFVTMTQYDATFTGIEIAYPPEGRMANTLGEYVSAQGKTQLRIAETEKYAHVTFFFSGGIEPPYAGEDRALIPSPKVATYDLQPSMSAVEVAQEAVKRVESGKYDLMILNFANCDMVGHTGVMAAAVEAVKTVDECVHTVVEAIRKVGGRCLVTADHGNAEQMIDPVTGEAFTAHTTNPVPLILIDDARKDAKLREGGVLADVSPTLLQLMGLPQPQEMTGKSLIEG